MSMFRSSPTRFVLAPTPRGCFEVFADDPDGLIYLDTFRSRAEALEEFPSARLVLQLWDAPVIDPADPSTHPVHPDDLSGGFLP